MAAQPKWLDSELKILHTMLDNKETWEWIAYLLDRSVIGVKIAAYRKLHYAPKCLSCNKRVKNRKGNKLRCHKCSKENTAKKKKINAHVNIERDRRCKNELRFGGNREKTLIRDCYKCQMCGKTHHEIMLDVHHKDKSGRNKQKHNHSLDNLLTLCHSCHTKIHKEDTIMKRWRK